MKARKVGIMNSLDGYGISQEKKKAILEEIISFFENERDEKIGCIAAEKVLEFFMEDLGKTIYNKALDDAKIFYDKKFEYIEDEFYSNYK